MKKLLALLLCLVLLASLLTACGNNASTDDDSDDERYKETKVIKTSETIGNDTFDFENIDSETVRITNFRSLDNEAHDVKIPVQLDGKTVISIGKASFMYKSNVKKVIFPTKEEFKAVGVDVDDPEFTFEIEPEAFYECAMETLTIPAYVTSVGEGAFFACRALQSFSIEAGSKITELPSYLFMSCEKLGTVTIPGFITSVGDAAFYGCESLTEFTAEEGVVSIGKQAVQNCFLLAKVTLASSVESIGKYAFNGSKVLYADSFIYTGSTQAVLDYIDSLSLEPRPIPESEEN